MAFQDIVTSQPALFIIVASLLIAVLITLIYKYTSNQKEMKRLKEELKSLQGRMKEHKGDAGKMMEVQKELAQKNLQYMSHSFKPMIFTFVPVILIFWWLGSLYKGIPVVLTIPGVGWNLSWVWTYIIFSFVFSMILRKTLKVH